jgi:hypothetical protein
MSGCVRLKPAKYGWFLPMLSHRWGRPQVRVECQIRLSVSASAPCTHLA